MDYLTSQNKKICIKEAIISKIKAKPKSFGCGCNNDVKKIKFIHRKYCRGELFLGELNGKISKALISKYSEPFIQFIYTGETIKDSESKLVLLKNEDLDYVKETYGKPEYVEEIMI